MASVNAEYLLKDELDIDIRERGGKQARDVASQRKQLKEFAASGGCRFRHPGHISMWTVSYIRGEVGGIESDGSKR